MNQLEFMKHIARDPAQEYRWFRLPWNLRHVRSRRHFPPRHALGFLESLLLLWRCLVGSGSRSASPLAPERGGILYPSSLPFTLSLFSSRFAAFAPGSAFWHFSFPHCHWAVLAFSFSDDFRATSFLH